MKLTNKDCWFLVKATDASHNIFSVDSVGCYKTGDLVQCYPGETNIELTSNPNMLMMGVTNLAYKDGIEYCKPLAEDSRIVTRRRHAIAGKIPPSYLADYEDCKRTGEPCIVPRGIFIASFLRDKVNG